MQNKPQHESHPLIQRAINLNSNELIVGGKKLDQIEGLVGSTPIYAYDKSLINDTVKQLKSMLPKRIKLHYAIKANPYPPVVFHLKSLVDGFDVASKKEMLLALQTGMEPAEISFAGPGKSDEDLTAAIIAGITLHAESVNEINRAISIGKKLQLLPQIAIRVNPAFELKSSGMKMSGGPKQFGIDEEQLPSILQHYDHKDYKLRGFHIFAGSQNLKEEALIEAHVNTFNLAIKLIKLCPKDIDYVNIGGGLGIPYFAGEKSLKLTNITQNLSSLISQFEGELKGKNVEFIIELGRYLVANSGVYISKIIDKKSSRGTTYLICDGGLHHHLANSGNFGQVIRKNYPVFIGNKLFNVNNHTGLTATEDTEQVEIVGPLCTPLDILANKVHLPKAEIGDYVVVMQSGAYGATASPQQFLSQPQLDEILL